MDLSGVAVALASGAVAASTFLAVLFRESARLISVLSMQNERQQREISEARGQHEECQKSMNAMKEQMASLQKSHMT